MPAVDPHRDLLDQVNALKARAERGATTGTTADPELEALAERIISEPATTVDGVLAKIRYLESVTWSDSMRRLAEGIRRDIEKLWPL